MIYSLLALALVRGGALRDCPNKTTTTTTTCGDCSPTTTVTTTPAVTTTTTTTCGDCSPTTTVTTTPAVPRWDTRLGECSKTCGDGEQIEVHYCLPNGDEKDCAGIPHPPTIAMPHLCNVVACPGPDPMPILNECYFTYIAGGPADQDTNAANKNFVEGPFDSETARQHMNRSVLTPNQSNHSAVACSARANPGLPTEPSHPDLVALDHVTSLKGNQSCWVWIDRAPWSKASSPDWNCYSGYGDDTDVVYPMLMRQVEEALPHWYIEEGNCTATCGGGYKPKAYVCLPTRNDKDCEDLSDWLSRPIMTKKGTPCNLEQCPEEDDQVTAGEPEVDSFVEMEVERD